jgi:hypothetical protein
LQFPARTDTHHSVARRAHQIVVVAWIGAFDGMARSNTRAPGVAGRNLFDFSNLRLMS